jgi:uncharacterized protein
MSSPRDYYVAILKDAGCDARVIAHCRTVADYALDLAGDNPLINRELLEAGAMLHDIGRGTTHSIFHAQAGADTCRALGLSEPIARIIECHTGAGLSADECTLLGLLPRDCIPRTIEERIVAHTDNLVKGTTPVTIDEMIGSAIHLKKKVRRRMYHLALSVETFCKK